MLADECLLDAGQFADAAGATGGGSRAVRRPAGRPGRAAPAATSVRPRATRLPWPRSTSTGCGPRTPAQFVSKGAAGGRRLTGVGVAAAVLDTVAGPTLQVASPRFVLTIVVQGRVPGDAAWRAAGRAALARLPS